MTRHFCDICGSETDAKYNGLNLNDRSGYGEDRRHFAAYEVCFACASRIIDTIETLQAEAQKGDEK